MQFTVENTVVLYYISFIYKYISQPGCTYLYTARKSIMV